MDNRTEPAVHRLLLRSLRDLESLPDDDWAGYVEGMTSALLHLDPDVGRTLVAVVRAEMTVRQLLMELLLPRPDEHTLRAIVTGARSLLDGLDEAPRTVAPGPRSRSTTGAAVAGS